MELSAKIEFYMKNQDALNAAMPSQISRRSQSPAVRRFNSLKIEQRLKIVFDKIRSLISSAKLSNLKKIICDDHKYCDNKDDIGTITQIINAIVNFFDELSGLVASLVFILLHKKADELCDCPVK